MTSALELVTVERREVADERVFDASIEATQQSTVSAQTGGRVTEVRFDIDDYVRKGEVLLRLTETEQRAALVQAEASLREAEARQREVREQHSRYTELLAQQHVSRQDMDRVNAELRAAEARLEAARAGVERAREQLEYTEVRAPYSGVVVERHVELGEAVGVGQPLMTGLSLERLRAVASVPQAVAAPLRRYESASVLLPGQPQRRIEAGRVTVTPYADPKTHSFRVRVDLPEGDYGVYPGSFVKLAFVVGREQRLLVPSGAIAYRSEVRGVYVAARDGTLGFRHVRLGRVRGRYTEVLAGLEAGERVATDPVRAAVELRRALDAAR